MRASSGVHVRGDTDHGRQRRYREAPPCSVGDLYTRWDLMSTVEVSTTERTPFSSRIVYHRTTRPTGGARMTTRQTTTVPLFVDGEGMSGGKVHHSIEVVR